MTTRFFDNRRRIKRAVRALVCGVSLLGLVAALLTLGWRQASAAPIRRLGQNPRALALGNTGVSYANDEMALYYNPAGLGSIDNWWIELLPVALEASEAGRDVIEDAGGGSFGDAQTFIDQNIDKDVALRGFFYPHIVFNSRPGLTFGASYFWEVQTEILITNAAAPEADAFFREDKGTVVGMSIPLVEGALLLGFSVRTIDRISAEGFISSADLAASAATGTLDVETLIPRTEGSATGYDFGLIWRMETFAFLRGQFGLSVSNVGGTQFKSIDATTTAPAEIPQEIAFGWSFRPEFSKAVPVMFAIERRDAANKLTADGDSGKRTHIGLEVGFIPQDKATNLLTFRAGLNGKSASYGVEFSLWHGFTLQYVVYNTEYGDADGEDSRERQILQLNVLGF